MLEGLILQVIIMNWDKPEQTVYQIPVKECPQREVMEATEDKYSTKSNTVTIRCGFTDLRRM